MFGWREGGLTNDRYLSIFDDAPFEGPPPPSLALQPLLLGGDRGLLVGFAVGSNFAKTASSIHPSIYPVVQRWGNRNQGRIQSAVVPALPPSLLTLDLALFRSEVGITGLRR